MAFSDTECVVYSQEKRDAMARLNKRRAHLKALAYQRKSLATDDLIPIPPTDMNNRFGIHIRRAFLKMNMKVKRMVFYRYPSPRRFS